MKCRVKATCTVLLAGELSLHGNRKPCVISEMGKRQMRLSTAKACKVQGPIGPIPVIQNAEYVI